MAGYETRQRGAGMRKRLRKVGKWIISPKVGLSVSAIFGVWDLVDAIRYAVMGRTGPAVYNWVLVGLMVWCCRYWAQRLREQKGGVLWIPKVKLAREFNTIKAGSYLVWCGNQKVEVGREYNLQALQVDPPVMKPGHHYWEVSLQLATEEVVEKYRNGRLQERENRKIKRRVLKEGRRGHRGNAANDPSGAAEGAGGEPGGQPPATEITHAIGQTGTLSISGVASSGLTKLLTGQTYVSLYSEIPDDDTTQPPEPDEELDTYTIPVWGFRSWNLLEGSLNDG